MDSTYNWIPIIQFLDLDTLLIFRCLSSSFLKQVYNYVKIYQGVENEDQGKNLKILWKNTIYVIKPPNRPTLGDIWINQTDDTHYVCVDNTVDESVWQQIM